MIENSILLEIGVRGPKVLDGARLQLQRVFHLKFSFPPDAGYLDLRDIETRLLPGVGEAQL